MDGPPGQTLVRALARGTGINLAGVAARIVFVIVHTLLAARLFGVEAYGLYTMGLAAVILLSNVAQLGMGRTVTRFVALYLARGEGGRVVATLRVALILCLPVSLGIGLTMGFRPAVTAKLFGQADLAGTFQVLWPAIPAFTLATLLGAFSQGFRAMLFNTVAMDLVRPTMEVVALVAALLLGIQNGLPVAYVLSLVVAVGLLIYFARIQIWRMATTTPPAHEVSSLPLRPILGFAMPILAVNILISSTDRATVLLLGALGTTAMVGVYGLLIRLVSVGTSLLTATNTMFGPMIADLVERNQVGQLGDLYKLSTRWILTVSLPFFLILLFYGTDLLRIFGSDFGAGGSALGILILATMINLATGSAGIILTMAGYPRYGVANEAIQLLVIVALSMWLIPVHGLLGAVWAYGAGLSGANLLRLLQVWWRVGIHPYDRRLGKSVAAAGIATGVLWAWTRLEIPGAPAVGLILGCVVALGSYGGLLVWAGLEPEDREIIGIVMTSLGAVPRRLGWV